MKDNLVRFLALPSDPKGLVFTKEEKDAILEEEKSIAQIKKELMEIVDKYVIVNAPKAMTQDDKNKLIELKAELDKCSE